MIDLKNKRVLVMGLGLIGGGVGVVKWLIKQGAKVTVTDLRTKKELLPSLKKLKRLPIKYILGKHRKVDFLKADLIIKNPGVPNDSLYLKIARKNRIPIETDMSLFFKYWPGQIIGVTGTKGKSTTVSLIYQILKVALLPVKIGGNIGKTPLQYLNAKMLKCSNAITTLELSSFQLENLKISPQIAVITNIYPDHLNRYKNMKEYIATKAKIFKYQKPNDYLILNYDSPILKKIFSKVPSQLILFSKKDISHIRPNTRMAIFNQRNKIFLKLGKQKKKVCSLENIKLIGQHNLENILAAVAVACLFKIKPKIIQKVLKNFKGLANRLELIRTVNGVKFYNDTAATTPEATMAALKTLSNIKNQISKIILIAGGSDKKLKFDKLARIIKKTCQVVILLPGSASKSLEYQIKRHIKVAENEGDRRYFKTADFCLFKVNHMREAVEQAKKIAAKGDIVLLSPACASFGLFKNEFDRGQQFKKWVKAINY